jgi:hypothetical protein
MIFAGAWGYGLPLAVYCDDLTVHIKSMGAAYLQYICECDFISLNAVFRIWIGHGLDPDLIRSVDPVPNPDPGGRK